MSKIIGIHERYALYVIAMFSVTIVILAMVVGTRVHENADQSALSLAREYKEHYGHIVKTTIDKEFYEVRALARSLESTLQQGGAQLNREQINKQLKYFIENNQQLLGVGVLFEPNAFDGRDRAFVDAVGHDASGRFMPYWSRNSSGHGVLEPVVGYDSEELGDYYLIPKETGRPALIEPYYYPVQGKERLVTSISIPLYDSSRRFVGVVGVDFTLEQLQNLIGKGRFFDKGSISVYTSGGVLVVGPPVTGKPRPESNRVNRDLLYQKIQEGEPFDLSFDLNVFSQDGLDYGSQKGKVIIYGHPVVLEELEERWMIVASIPEAELYAQADSLTYEVIAIGIVILLVIIFSGFFAAHSLRQREAKFRAIFENTGIGMLVVNNRGDFVSANPIACQLLGYSQDELLEQSIYSLTFDDDVDMTRRYFSEFMNKTRKYYQVEKRYRCKSGEIRWVRLSLSVFSDLDDPSFFYIGMIEDIEQQKRVEFEGKQLEARLQQAQKMETIGQLTGGIAHDFNNILASILGYTGLALEKLSEDPGGKLTQYLREVYRGGERARDLIAQMLAFSRPQATAPEVFRPAAMIHEVVKLLRPSLPQSIMIRIDTPEEMLAISMDPVHFHQLLMNLCINARDAMQGKGEMRILMQEMNTSGVSCSSCGQQVEGRFLQISVQDSGEGIKPELLSQLFDPFFTTKEVGKGTGMGLSMVHGLAHEHQGHVVVESKPGQGSCFNLLFPIKEVDPEVPALMDDRAERHCATEEPNILVAEDESVLARFLTELLEIRGYRVTSCGNGREALARFQQQPMAYDLLITDQTMPEMTGLELTQAIHRVRAELPVILCTGFSDALDEQVALGMGVSRYFQKPVDADQLLDAIESCLLTTDGASQKRAISGK